MVKKLFTLALGLTLAVGLNAQTTDSAIDTADIKYWVGEGTSHSVFIFDLQGTTLAWGYRYNASDAPTAFDMVTAIDKADPRFVLGVDWETYSYVYTYVEWPLKIAVSEDDTRFKVDGALAEEGDMLADYDLEDGTVVRISDDEADTWSNPVSAASVATLPVDATIAAADVKYWVGEGANQAVVVYDWTSNGRALAWGLRFGDEAPTADSALKMVAAADPRLTLEMDSNRFSFVGPFTMLQSAEGYVQYVLDGNPYTGPYSQLQNGSFLKIGESNYATGWDSTEYAGMWFPSAVVWTTRIDPVGAPFDTVNSTIDPKDIVYWVGTGDKQAVMVFNWAGRSLAWGYRFAGDATVEQAMNDIQAADPRFSFTAAGGYLSDIVYVEQGKDSLKGVAYWEQMINGGYGWGLTQPLADGDLNLWADAAAGTVVDSAYYDGWGWSYNYRYTMPIEPASNPAGIAEARSIDLTIYPNPVAQQLNVAIQPLDYDFLMQLFDINGRCVMSTTVPAGTSHLQVAVDHLAAGVYMLSLGGSTAKVVVRR